MLLLSILPILFHGFNPEYGHAIWVLILGCVIYSGLDSLNSKLMKRGEANFMSHVLQNEHEEQVEVISFWDNAISFAVYLIFAFASPFPSPDKFLTVWPLILGCGLSIAGVLPLILTAYTLQNISSLQFIRIVEPLLAGILIDLDGIPVHMLVCISVFGLASLYGFGKNLGLF